MVSGNPTALIFGAGGQDGRHLSELLTELGWEVVPVSRSGGPGLLRGDIADRSFALDIVERSQPDYLFHLAARSSTCHEALRDNHRSIATGTWNVLEAVERHCPRARVFITGSGLQFENVGQPIHERDPFAATSAYAVERIHSVYAARYYRGRGIRTFVGYLFHHESPLRGPGHISTEVASAARRIAAGSDETLELGDLDVEKEWTFAGDVAKAILLLVSQDEVPETVIGSGRAHSIREWVELCFAEAGLDWQRHVREIQGFAPEYRRLVSDPATIHALGWRPELEIAELCRLMMQSSPDTGTIQPKNGETMALETSV